MFCLCACVPGWTPPRCHDDVAQDQVAACSNKERKAITMSSMQKQRPSPSPSPFSPTPTPSSGCVRGYPAIFFVVRRPWLLSILVSASVAGAAVVLSVRYGQTSPDVSPDSPIGLLFAVAGTLSLLFAATYYSIRRRVDRRPRNNGTLNALLQWHVAIGCLALVLCVLHAFGNYNLRTGTYALYALLALILSGIVGRILDHILPRMIAIEVERLLTAEGNSRLDEVTKQLEMLVAGETRITVLSPQLSDLSRRMPQMEEIVMRLHNVLPHASALVSEIQDIHRAMRREQFYRYLIRVWRWLHIVLAALTIILTGWHIIFALRLMLS